MLSDWSISVTDDKVNTYTVGDFVFDSSQNYSFASAYATNVTNAPTTITATLLNSGTPDTSDFASILVDEFSGLTASDGHHGQKQDGIGPGSDVVTPGNLTTSSSGDLVWGANVNISGGGDVTSGTGFTQAQHVAGVFTTEYMIVGSAGTYSANFSASGSTSASTVGIAFTVPSAGSAGEADGSSSVSGVGAEIFKASGEADGSASVSGAKYVPTEIVLTMSDLSKLLNLTAHDGSHIVSTLRDLVAASGNYDKTKVLLGDGSLSIVSIFVPPTSDPHIAGAVWNSSGTLTISAG